MSSLVQKIISVHGGLDRWNSFNQLSARLHQGGAIWELKGQGGKLTDTTVTVGLRTQWASHAPFGSSDKKTLFVPGKVSILDSHGMELESLDSPRASFKGHSLETPWSELQLAYFAGYAMWTYLNLPFALALPGVATETLDDWKENGEHWNRLKVLFPENIETHSRVQTLYVDEVGLLKRHDYDVEITGATPGAHYIDGYVSTQGLKFPTRRRIFPRQPDGRSLTDPLVVSIDLSELRLT